MRAGRADLTRVQALRVIALMFVVAGLAHFVVPHTFERIVPSWVPNPKAVVFWSGIAEIAGAIGLLVPATRVYAAWGLIALLVSVFPANVQMLLEARARDTALWWQPALWIRLPMQPLLIWFVWRSAIHIP